MEKKNKTYKEPLRGLVDNGVKYDSRSKPDNSRDEIPVYARSDTSQCWIIDYLQSESKTYFPTRLTLERSKPRGNGQSAADNLMATRLNQSSRLQKVNQPK